ncbi:MAG: hypothetical protein ABJE47_18145 [bacterium]
MIAVLMRQYLNRRLAVMSLVAGVLLVRWPVAAVAGLFPLVLGLWRVFPMRANLFELGLPIRGRDLFAARLSVSLLVITPPLVAWVIASQVQHSPVGTIDIRLDALVTVILAVIVSSLVRPAEVNASRARVVLLPWGVLGLASAAVAYASPSHVAPVLLALAIPGALFAAWRVVPDALQVAPPEPEGASAPASFVGANHGEIRGGRSDLLATEDREEQTGMRWSASRAATLGARMVSPVTALTIRAAVAPTVMVFWGLMLFAALNGQWLFMYCIALLSSYDSIRGRVDWLKALPFSHRRRLLTVLIPGNIAMLVAVLIGMSIDIPFLRFTKRPDTNAPHSWYARGDYFSSPTRVSLEYWSRMGSETVPVITAPWGEQAAADTITVLGIALFNPYTSVKGSSDAFVKWQYARLTTAVFGHPVPYEEYSASRAFPPSRTQSARMRLLNLATVAVLALFMAWAAEFRRWRRFALVGTTLGRALVWVPALLTMGLIGVDARYTSTGAQVVVPMAERALLFVNAALPQNILAVCIAALLPVVAMYALLEWQFSQSER